MRLRLSDFQVDIEKERFKNVSKVPVIWNFTFLSYRNGINITEARLIQRHVMNTAKITFMVDYDFRIITYLANRVIVFDAKSGFLLRALNYFLR
jgi:hypothetical protein